MKNLENFWRPKSKLSKRQIIDEETLNSGDYESEEKAKVKVVEKKVQHETASEEAQDETVVEEKIPEALIDADVFIGKNGWEQAEKIYEYYYKAMTRKDRRALEKDRFLNHFFRRGSSEKNYLFGDQEKGYLLGVLKYSAFIPTHFAPKSIRTGVALIKELGGNKDLPVAMAITEDLEAMVARIPGWTSVDTAFLSEFRGMLVNKKIVHNNHPEIYKLATGLLDDYMEEQRRWEDYDKDYNKEAREENAE